MVVAQPLPVERPRLAVERLGEIGSPAEVVERPEADAAVRDEDVAGGPVAAAEVERLDTEALRELRAALVRERRWPAR